MKPSRAVLLVGALLCASVFAGEIRVGGTGASLGTLAILAGRWHEPGTQVHLVPNLGSSGSVKALRAGAIDLAVVSRPVSEADLDRMHQVRYACTPFVFAVSPQLALTGVTHGELVSFYSGRQANWSDGTPIRIVLRPESDVESSIVASVSAELREAQDAARRRPGVHYAVNDQDAATALESIHGAFGPTTLALILSEKRSLKALVFDGVQPTPANAASGAYRLSKCLYFVSPSRPSVAVERFVGYVQSPAGRQVLQAYGHWVPR